MCLVISSKTVRGIPARLAGLAIQPVFKVAPGQVLAKEHAVLGWLQTSPYSNMPFHDIAASIHAVPEHIRIGVPGEAATANYMHVF